MIPDRLDLRHLITCLDQPEIRACGEAHVATLRALLVEAVVTKAPGQSLIMRGDRALGRILPFGSVALYVPGHPASLRHRLIEVDRGGRVVLAVQRGPEGEFQNSWVRNVDGALLGILPHGPGDVDHVLWGASDRIVRLEQGRDPELLTVCGTVSWNAIAHIPPLADPGRLPPGAGTSILNVLAVLATDQESGPLRYRGPYPTEQLFWALTESFRFAPTTPNPIPSFTRDAETAFAERPMREAPLDWRATPHERVFLDQGIYVQLREGVEKVYWEGRMYYRAECQGLRRREHRVIRAVAAPNGGLTLVASIEALGRSLEDHLVLDQVGNLVAPPAPADPGHSLRDGDESRGDTPLAGLWTETLGVLLPLEATPLLAAAIGAVWPGLRVVWGPVPRDLIDTRGETLRLSRALGRVYQAERAALPATARRPLAQRLVREVLALLGPPVRRAATAWLEAEPPARQEEILEVGKRLDRRALAARAATPVTRLLDTLEAGQALPD